MGLRKLTCGPHFAAKGHYVPGRSTGPRAQRLGRPGPGVLTWAVTRPVTVSARHRECSGPPSGSRHHSRGRRRRPVLRRATVIAAGLVVTGAATAAATGLVPIFQPQTVAPVVVQAGDLSGLGHLTQFGTFSTQHLQLTPEPTAGALSRAAGFAVPSVAAPAGVGDGLSYWLVLPDYAQVRISVEKISRAAVAAGATAPTGCLPRLGGGVGHCRACRHSGPVRPLGALIRPPARPGHTGWHAGCHQVPIIGGQALGGASTPPTGRVHRTSTSLRRPALVVSVRTWLKPAWRSSSATHPASSSVNP